MLSAQQARQKTMPNTATPGTPPDFALPRLSRAGFVLAWCVFWLLLVTVAVQDYLRQGHAELWQPLLWEGSSCLVASAIVWSQWHRLHSLDVLLAQPRRWFFATLLRLPLIAIGFVVTVYALRHGVYAALGETYRHEAWGAVFLYETLKFGLFYLLFVAILFGIRSHAALSDERLQSERARALSQQAQLLQLTQQIEPHFLFNALNTISATIHTNPELADSLLTRLAALLRAATTLARQPEVPLAEELRLLEAYAAIMQERFADRVSVRFEIEPLTTQCRVPTLVLQPLLENAFRHGVETRSQPTTIVVRARRAGSRLRLEVHDDAGVLPATPVFGVGLSNLQQRLALRYGDRAALSLARAAGSGVNA
ncbi:MAG: histidine kinase, partial [Burkholderiaceae bacterium]